MQGASLSALYILYTYAFIAGPNKHDSSWLCTNSNIRRRDFMESSQLKILSKGRFEKALYRVGLSSTVRMITRVHDEKNKRR